MNEDFVRDAFTNAKNYDGERGTLAWALATLEALERKVRDDLRVVYSDEYLEAAAVLYRDDPLAWRGLQKKLKNRGVNASDFDRKTRDKLRELKDREKEEKKQAQKQAAQASRAAANSLNLKTYEPWPDRVDGSLLIAELCDTLSKYVVLPRYASIGLALWILHSHLIDAAEHAPRLALLSPQPRCGKTTAQILLSKLVPRALPASNVSAAAIFRVVESEHPTLLLDEIDSFLENSDELRGILNSGHSREMAFVVRVEGDKHETHRYSTFAAMTLSAIGKLPATLADRSIVIKMRRRKASEKVEKLKRSVYPALEVLARKCARFAADSISKLTDADPAIPDALNDRAADNWRPLLAIADLAGGVWPAAAREAALALSGEDVSGSTSVFITLLSDLRDLFAEHGDKLLSKSICDWLAEMETRPWPEWRDGKPITTSQLARALATFDIAPKTLRLGTTIAKGYEKKDCLDAFSRYLDDQDVTTLQPNAENDFEHFSSSVTDEACNGSEKCTNPNAENECNVVTAQKPANPANHEKIEEVDLE